MCQTVMKQCHNAHNNNNNGYPKIVFICFNPFNPSAHNSDRKKVFIYKALKTSLTGVLVNIPTNMETIMKYVQCVTWPYQNLEKMITASKLWNKRLVKYVNIKIWQRFLVHVIFRVSSINICICIYSVLLSVVIEWVNMLMVTIVTAG